MDHMTETESMCQNEAEVQQNEESTPNRFLREPCESVETQESDVDSQHSWNVSQLDQDLQPLETSEEAHPESITEPNPWSQIGISCFMVENRMIVPVVVNGKQVNAMIDMGANRSMVLQSWVEQGGLKFCPLAGHIQGFGVDNCTPTLGEVGLDLAIHHLQLKAHPFVVMSSEHSSAVPLVIGEDFLKTNRIRVNQQLKRLRQVHPSGAISDYYLGDGRQACEVVIRNEPCVAAADFKIAPGEEIPVPLSYGTEARWGGGCDCRTTPLPDALYFEDNCSLKSVSVLPGIVSVSRPMILVANDGRNAIRVRKGDVLGTLSSLVIEQSDGSNPEVFVADLNPDTQSSGPRGKLNIPEVINVEHLPESAGSRVLDMIGSREVVLSAGEQDIGKFGSIEHRIELLEDTPIYQPPRRFHEEVNEKIEEGCKELLVTDIIEPSKSAWSSPVVPIRKKDGTLRLCIDYRRLNAVTKADKHPLPNLNDALYSLHGVKYFTSLDLVKGYYHLPLEESSREYTAFSTPRGHYQFKRLSFGLKNAPAAFQREMMHVLSGFPWRKVIVYIDDVLIMSETFDEHLTLVGQVLDTLASHGVKIKPAKCKWFMAEVDFLGHRVSPDGLQKLPSYVEQIKNVPRPTNVRELRQFLGLANFQRKFVPHFSEVQKPLSEKTGGRGAKKLVWTQDMEQAFEQLKEKLAEDVRLSFPDYAEHAQPLELYVDASGVGAGACLVQQQDEETKIIAYASTCFNPAEVKYSTIERELAALRWGVKIFRPFLDFRTFVIHTDHQPLIYLHNMQLIDARLARTLHELSGFNFEIRYTPGKQNLAADALSRLHTDRGTQEVQETFVPGMLPAGLVLAERVPGGGDALIESLWIVSNNVQCGGTPLESTRKLRECLVDELLLHPERYNLVLDRDGRKRLKVMRHPGQMPAAELILAFSHVFKCLVLVHYGGTCPIEYLAPSVSVADTLPRVHLQCLANVHYNPVLETTGYRMHRRRLAMPDSDGSAEDPVCGDGDSENPEAWLQVADPSQVEVEDAREHSPWCMFHRQTHIASVMIQVGGERFCAMLDNGAQLSCISARAFAAARTQLQPTALMISGFGPHATPARGLAIVVVTLPTVGLATPIRFAVVDDNVMPCCVILGTDYLAVTGLEVAYDNSTCLLGDTVVDQLRTPVSDVAYAVGLVGQVSQEPTKMVDDTRRSMTCADNVSLQSDGVTEWRIGTPTNNLRFAVSYAGCSDVLFSSLMNRDDVELHQRKSTVLRTLKRNIEQQSSTWPRSLSRFWRYRANLFVLDGIVVFSETDKKTTWVVTFQFLVEVMLVLHYRMVHLGRQKLIEMTRQHVWHPSASKVASDITVSCNKCQRMKVSPVVAPPVIKVQASVPFDLVAMDLVALPPHRGFIGCLVVMDHCSKWLNAVPIRSKTAETVAAAMEHRILPFLPRRPRRVLTDNGPEFVGGSFEDMLALYGIQHVRTTPNHPSSNGLVERANRTLIELLRVQVTAKEWHDVLPRAIMMHNTSYHSALKQSPSQYLLETSHAMKDMVLIPDEVREQWREGHSSFGTFHFDQHVLRKVVLKGNLAANKFQPRFEGPYRVTRVNKNGVTYVLAHCESGVEVKAHHGQLKAYHQPPAYLRKHPYFQQLLLKEDVHDFTQPSVPMAPTYAVGGPVNRYVSSYSDSDSESTDESTDSETTLDSIHDDTSLTPVELVQPSSPAGVSRRPPRPELHQECETQVSVKETVQRQASEVTAEGHTGTNNIREVTTSMFASLSPVLEHDSVQAGAGEDLLVPNLVLSSDTENDSTHDVGHGDPVANNGQNAILPTTVEGPSGIIVEAEQEFWDLSEISLVENPLQQTFIDNEERLELLSESLAMMNVELNLMGSLFGFWSSSSSSFTGFDRKSTVHELTSCLDDIQHRVSLIASELHKPLDEIVVPTAEELEHMQRVHVHQRSTVKQDHQKKQRDLRNIRSPIRTRASGKVPDAPTVQPRTLEYKKYQRRRLSSL